MTVESFARRLMLARVRRTGMTVKAFAERFGVEAEHVEMVEAGRLEPDVLLLHLVETIERAAQATPPSAAPYGDGSKRPAAPAAPRRIPKVKVILPKAPDPDADRRDLWRRWQASREAIRLENLTNRGPGNQIRQYPMPAELRGLPCGARTRSGGLCKRTELGPSGRCKLHGGASTGPKTAEGKARQLQNLATRWLAHRAAKAAGGPDSGDEGQGEAGPAAETER